MSHVIPTPIQRKVDERDLRIDRLRGHYIGPGRNLHHRKLLSRGGDDEVANIITLSGSGTTGTHGWVHANVGEATRLGFIVPSWATPLSAVPIYLADSRGRTTWKRLTDAGVLVPMTDSEAEAAMRRIGIWQDQPLF